MTAVRHLGFSYFRNKLIADHLRLVFDGPNILLKLRVNRVYTLADIAIFILGRFGLKLPIHAPFWGVFRDITFKWIPILSPPQQDRYWVKTRHMSHKPWKSIHGSTWARAREKIQYKKKQKKSHKTVIFHLTEEKPPLNGLKWKFALDRIMDIKFKFEKFQWFWCHWGVKIRPFPLTFQVCTWALPQCSATALPVIVKHT